jgi:hypothetical protein
VVYIDGISPTNKYDNLDDMFRSFAGCPVKDDPTCFNVVIPSFIVGESPYTNPTREQLKDTVYRFEQICETCPKCCDNKTDATTNKQVRKKFFDMYKEKGQLMIVSVGGENADPINFLTDAKCIEWAKYAKDRGYHGLDLDYEYGPYVKNQPGKIISCTKAIRTIIPQSEGYALLQAP